MVGLKSELVSGREGELYELRMRCEQLTRTVETLEEQLQQQVCVCVCVCVCVRACVRACVWEVMVCRQQCVPTQHSDSEQLSPLRERERELREELLQSQRENMTLRFDYEQAVLELPRLRVSVVM